MLATPTPSGTCTASNDIDGATPALFSQVFISNTKQEHFALKMAATQRQGLQRKAVARCDQQDVRHARLIRELKAQALKSNAALQAKLDTALAQVRNY